MLLLFTLTLHCLGQVDGQIASSRTNTPVEGVEVFIAGTSIVSASDASGRFLLEHIQPGYWTLVMYKQGFELFSSSIKIETDRQYHLNLRLDPAIKWKVKGLQPQQDSGRLKRTLSQLLGVNAGSFTDENLQSIKQFEGADRILVEALKPLRIQSPQVGYERVYFLKTGFYTKSSGPVALHYFREMPSASEAIQIGWNRERRQAYEGSLQHFLKCLTTDHLKEDGFSVKQTNGKWLKSSDMVVRVDNGYRLQHINDSIEIVYSRRGGEKSGLLIKNGVLVNDSGVPFPGVRIDVDGSMLKQSQESPLPSDYQPVNADYGQYVQYYEQPYLHTDRSYYYAGDVIWFKGYVNHFTPRLKDSISQVVYVDLMNERGEVVQKKRYRMKSGIFDGDMLIPDLTKSGTYFFRAYTEFQRNFGEDKIFTKPISVLNLFERITKSPQPHSEISSGIKIVSDKTEYHVRERIELSILGIDSGYFSVAVTDAEQVAETAADFNILSQFNLKVDSSQGEFEFLRRPERGLTERLKYSPTSQPVELTLIQENPRQVNMIQTSETGEFTLSDLAIRDSALFYFRPSNRKLATGEVTILPSSHPTLVMPSYKPPVLESASTVQRLRADYETPSSDKMLEAVEIRGKKWITDTVATRKEYGISHPYGKPNYVIKGKDLGKGYGNLLLALPGKVPGLVVRQVPGDNGLAGGGFRWVVYVHRAATSSIANVKEVLVLVDNAMLGGTPEQILTTINPDDVESIEVTTRINPLYGSAGAFGVLSIRTRNAEANNITQGMDAGFKKFYLRGFSTRHSFTSPDYSDSTVDHSQADFRSTLLWAPYVFVPENKSVSFFASDLDGWYRVEVEGVTNKGVAVRAVKYLRIKPR